MSPSSTSTNQPSNNNPVNIIRIKAEPVEPEVLEPPSHSPSTKEGNACLLSATQNQPVLDLREWKAHRVLAKKDGVYMPGMIVAVSGHSTITVAFDGDGLSVSYTDVILSTTSFYDIVSDASPTPQQVNILIPDWLGWVLRWLNTNNVIILNTLSDNQGYRWH
jgi:hypothetical protein